MRVSLARTDYNSTVSLLHNWDSITASARDLIAFYKAWKSKVNYQGQWNTLPRRESFVN